MPGCPYILLLRLLTRFLLRRMWFTKPGGAVSVFFYSVSLSYYIYEACESLLCLKLCLELSLSPSCSYISSRASYPSSGSSSWSFSSSASCSLDLSTTCEVIDVSRCFLFFPFLRNFFSGWLIAFYSFLVMVPTYLRHIVFALFSSLAYTSSRSSPFVAVPPLPGSRGNTLLYLLLGTYYSTKLWSNLTLTQCS